MGLQCVCGLIIYLSVSPLLLCSCMLYVCPYFSAALIDPLLCFDSVYLLCPFFLHDYPEICLISFLIFPLL